MRFNGTGQINQTQNVEAFTIDFTNYTQSSADIELLVGQNGIVKNSALKLKLTPK
jgi:hypothetical protein